MPQVRLDFSYFAFAQMLAIVSCKTLCPYEEHSSKFSWMYHRYCARMTALLWAIGKSHHSHHLPSTRLGDDA